MNDPITLASAHLSQGTLEFLSDCASNRTTGHDAVFTADGVLYTLPKEKYPHLPSDLAACVMKALDAGTDKILFSDAAELTPGLPAYPRKERD